MATQYSNTLCTSFLNYYKTPLENATMQLRLTRLKPLLDLHIPICIFAGVESHIPLEAFVQQHYEDASHIHIVPLRKHIFEVSVVFQEAKRAQTQKLPKDLSPPKDTYDYMCYLHSKVEFLKMAAELNPFETSYFTWVDYNISQILSETLPFDYLKELSCRELGTQTLPPTEFTSASFISPNQEIYIPGCWKDPHYEKMDFYEKVLWRFCGGFLCGRKEAIEYLWSLYMDHFYEFLKESKTMVWDVNFWAYMEQNPSINWSPVWYEADHNDTIVKIPMFAQCKPILPLCCRSRAIHSVHIPDFHPSAVSMVTFTNSQGHTQHVMNIRHVNYTYLPSGHCTIAHPNNATCSKNVCANVELENYYVPSDLQKTCAVVDESDMGLPPPPSDTFQYFQGIEDIRLFYHQHRVQFLATTVNYSGCDQNRIVIGDYDYHGNALRYVRVIHPPINTSREKNWIPIVHEKQLYVLYTWSPFRIGTMESVTVVEIEEEPEDQLIMKIHSEKRIQNALFQQFEMRGSTNFVHYDGHLVGLIHFTVPGTLPKQYYHLLVQIDPCTWTPLKYSDPFYFDSYGVEFCIHMDVYDRKNEKVMTEDPMTLGKTPEELLFAFYLSRQDTNPHQICFHASQFHFCNEFKIE